MEFVGVFCRSLVGKAVGRVGTIGAGIAGGKLLSNALRHAGGAAFSGYGNRYYRDEDDDSILSLLGGDIYGYGGRSE